MNNSRKLTKKTFTESLKGSALNEIRDKKRKEVLAFVNENVGEENLVTITECRSDSYWDCVVWYWKDTTAQ